MEGFRDTAPGWQAPTVMEGRHAKTVKAAPLCQVRFPTSDSFSAPGKLAFGCRAPLYHEIIR